jgi:hypothetical protein
MKPRISMGGVSLLAIAIAGLLPGFSSTVFPVFAAAAPGPGAIGIDFVGRGTPMGSAETAGVVSRSRWNNASGASRSTRLALVDETGAVTGATLTWKSDSVGSTGISDRSGNNRLMKGYLDTSFGHPTTVTVSGLQARAYDIYVYVDGDNGGASRSGTYQVGGTGITAASVTLTDAPNKNFAGTFTRASNSPGNYVTFSINATGFTLTATPGAASDGRKRAPINGLQIVPSVSAPPPVFTISGSITPSSAGAGATMSLGGSAAATTVADASGAYTFGGLANGNYAVIPGKPGYAFSPTSRNVTINGANAAGVNFTATEAAPTYTISGTVSPLAGGAGTTLTLTGAASAIVTADVSGNYVLSGLASGSYTITPANSGYAFAPASRDVAIDNASITGVNFTAQGPDRNRANSYDNEWESAWVSHARALLQAPGKTAGFVLEIGDSITHSMAYATWARQGQGRTTEDLQAVSWARATSWGNGNFDVTSKNGWYLADADTTLQRGMTSSGGLSTGEFLSGSGNGGPDMPVSADAVLARQILADATYAGNLEIDTLLAAFGDAQFAVVMLGTNDPGTPDNLSALSTIVDKLEAQHVVTILSTVPPRNDAFSNDLNVQFNAGIRNLARTRSLPLIDYYQEILLRRPGTTWFGTLISSDGVHPTGSGAGFSPGSNPYTPGGDPATHRTGDAPSNVGYLLRSWLTIQKLKEVKQYVIDGIDPLL